MAATTNKALLFVGGGIAAAAVVAYAVGAFNPPIKHTPETIAALPESGQANPKDARLPETQAPEAALETPAEQPAVPLAPSIQESAAPAAGGEPEVIPPNFDVVRVESNGSIVIAGKTVPSAKVDLLVGSNVIGSATADAGGDFAVVLDDPLKPGDYQIVLRATAPDNVVAMSVETAVVSVPETPDGQVLALVEEPGKPSHMITLPAPQPPSAPSTPPANTAVAQAQAPAEPAAETSPAAEAPAAAEPKPEGEMQAALPQPAEPAPAPAAPTGPTVRVEAVEIDGRKIFVAGVADPGRTVRGYANEILLGDAKASPDGRYLIEADRDLPVGDYIIRVDALQPDGVKVASRAAVPFEREPGETIAAVAPPPEPVAPPVVVESPAAGAPAAGAAAPSTEAEAVPVTPQAAAEAPAASLEQPAQPPAMAEAPAEEAPAPAEVPEAAATTPAQEVPAVTEAPVKQPPASANPPPAEAADGADPGSQPANEPTAQPPAGAPAVAKAPEEPAVPATDAPAATAPAAAESQSSAAPPRLQAARQAPAVQPSAPANTETSASPPPDVAETSAPQLPTAETAAPEAPAPVTPPAGETEVAAAPAQELPVPPSADGVSEVLAPKLQSVDSAVIIRRGDTLWRISRRVYGRGVRYSTIYLANQTQIEDPDRIWPGQVFKVPEKSDDGKAEADYSRLGNRLTTVPKESAD